MDLRTVERWDFASKFQGVILFYVARYFPSRYCYSSFGIYLTPCRSLANYCHMLPPSPGSVAACVHPDMPHSTELLSVDATCINCDGNVIDTTRKKQRSPSPQVRVLRAPSAYELSIPK